MIITKDEIKALNPCQDAYRWYLSTSNGVDDLEELLLRTNAENPYWAQWLYIRLMTLDQKRKIAVFAAEQVIDIFEKKYPNDDRPRKAIEAAKAVIQSDTLENRLKARDAAAAYAATDARKEMQEKTNQRSC